MGSTVALPQAGYSFIPGVFQYSAGVAALPGFRIERVRFAEPVPLKEGFRRIEATLQAAGRPPAAFCACELRSPAPFTETGFRQFNEVYVGTLQKWGVVSEGRNPVARSNVCPALDPPPEPSFHAFCFTTAAENAPASFVVAGSGEAPEGKGSYQDHIIARGDVGPAGLRRKAAWVLEEMERRMAAFGASWRDTTAVQLYTVPRGGDRRARRGAQRPRLALQPPARPRDRIRDGLPCGVRRAGGPRRLRLNQVPDPPTEIARS
jgi:hypothetical protein